MKKVRSLRRWAGWGERRHHPHHLHLPPLSTAPPPNTHQKALCVHARWPCWPQLLGPRCFQNTWSMKGSEGMFCLKWLNPALSYNTICSEIDSLKMGVQGTSPVVQWLGVCLPMQGKRVRSLVLEDPTFCAAAKPVSCSRWAGAVQPEARSKRGHHNEKPSHRSSDPAQPFLKKKKGVSEESEEMRATLAKTTGTAETTAWASLTSDGSEPPPKDSRPCFSGLNSFCST